MYKYKIFTKIVDSETVIIYDYLLKDNQIIFESIDYNPKVCWEENDRPTYCGYVLHKSQPFWWCLYDKNTMQVDWGKYYLRSSLYNRNSEAWRISWDETIEPNEELERMLKFI